MDEASGEGRKDQKNKDDQLGCVDYRKYTFAQMIMIDDGLAERGLTLPLLMIMTVNVSMATCSFTSIFMSTQASVSLDNVRCFLLGISVSLSLFNQYVSRKGIARLRDFFETSMRSLRTGFPEERTIIDDARRAATSQLDMYVKIFACNNVVMMFVQPIGELMSGRSWKKLPIQWTFPPSDNEFSFWLIFLFQFTGLFFAHCVGVMTMSFTSITIQMTALFDVLVFSIGNIEKRAAARTQQTGSDYHAALLACLKDDVAHYQQLIRALSSITPYLRNTFLIVSAAVPMVMACEAYPIMQVGAKLL